MATARGNYVSRKLGARQYEDAEKMSSTAFFTALATGVVLGALGIGFIRPISRLLGSTETILPYTVRYLRIIFVGTPFIMGSFVLNNQLRFQGNASSAMVGIITGAVLNIVLDPIFIFTLNMGISGAALATVIGQAASFAVLLRLDLRQAAIPVRWRRFTPNAYYYSNMFRGGIPSLCRQGIGSVATICLNLAAGLYGGVNADAAIAAVGIVTRISMFANSALIGFGQGFQPVCGTNYGAGKYRRVRQAFFFCLKVGTAALVVISLAAFAFAEPLITFFRNDPAVVSIGTVALRFHCAVFVLNVWVILCNMLLQTIGMALPASILASSRQGIFFVPAVFLLPLAFGLLGVQMAQTVADLCTFALSIPLTLPVLRSFSKDRDEG